VIIEIQQVEVLKLMEYEIEQFFVSRNGFCIVLGVGVS